MGQAADLRHQLTAAQKNLTAIKSQSKEAATTSREKELAEKVATLEAAKDQVEEVSYT